MRINKTVEKTVTADAGCASCIYFAPAAAAATSGICRRHPPGPAWPEVSAIDWCGDYEPKAGWE